MGKSIKSRVAAISLAAMAMIALLPQGASALVETPDEEDFIDIVDELLLNPNVLPRLIDAGLIHEQIEDLLPDLIDVWPTVSIGAGCGLSTSGPSISSSGLRVRASATYSCSQRRTSIGVALCLQIRQGDQWVTMEGSCRKKHGADQSSVHKKTSAYCRPGTWHYRVIAEGEAFGPNAAADFALSNSAPARLNCRTFGL